jgi:tryptophan halogenase
MKPPLDVVIVGGGTAGWMAAAGLAGVLSPEQCRVRLVESDEIGTVGVGEATLPHMKTFNQMIGLSEPDMMRDTKATFKIGIEFVDWGFKGSSYIHPFGAHGRPAAGVPFQHHWLRAQQNGRDFDIEEFSYAIVASRRNRFDFPGTDRAAIDATYDYAYHFDASLFARVLRGFAEARGVTRTEGKVVEASLHPERGDIASIRLESGEVVAGDFFIDCSGFRSLLLGQTLNNPFEDWTKWLPCDRALAVPSERVGDLTPYTRSTAREAGWQWRIPLQHRTGNGYVFSSDFIGEDEAADALMRNLGAPALDDPRLLKFKAGRRLKSWQGNCMALGLASGFLEPLESTSIYLIQVGIVNLLQLLPAKTVDPELAREFNRRMDVEYERIRDFLILHYHATSRDDSELWRYCRAMDVPESLKRKIDQFVHRGHIEAYKDGLFTPPSWLSVYLGQGLRPQRYHPMADMLPLDRLIGDLEAMRDEIGDRVEAMPAHAAFIDAYCPAIPTEAAS